MAQAISDTSDPDPLPRATFSGEREVNGITIFMHNLDDGRRVLSERSFMAAIGMQGRGNSNGHRITRILADPVLKHLFSNELLMDIANPIRFMTEQGRIAFGYTGRTLNDFCISFVKAKSLGACKTEAQRRYAQSCEDLVLSFAGLGIDAWIDEATGFDKVRERDALNKLLDKYMRDYAARWAKTFPDEFYVELFRLKRLPYRMAQLQKPGCVGGWTNDIVYSRLAPGVLKALREKNPIVSPGRRRFKHHQYLSDDFGHPKLREHLSNLLFLMRGYDDWGAFYRRLQRIAPRLHETPEFDFGEE